ncbi:hypothetical protein ACQPYH_17115 [Kribbella sp. CA-245084]|uniref:hypothetical protein n=1 Tax=Kribbella sp. CA-245084 TaxID=3239940 RepID=UPI003D8AB254
MPLSIRRTTHLSSTSAVRPTALLRSTAAVRRKHARRVQVRRKLAPCTCHMRRSSSASPVVRRAFRRTTAVPPLDLRRTTTSSARASSYDAPLRCTCLPAALNFRRTTNLLRSPSAVRPQLLPSASAMRLRLRRSASQNAGNCPGPQVQHHPPAASRSSPRRRFLG